MPIEKYIEFGPQKFCFYFASSNDCVNGDCLRQYEDLDHQQLLLWFKLKSKVLLRHLIDVPLVTTGQPTRYISSTTASLHDVISYVKENGADAES